MKNFSISIAALTLALAPGSAFAADLPTQKAPPVVAAPAPMWAGFYAGVNAGASWGNNSNLNASTYTLSPGVRESVVDAALLTGNAGNLSGNVGFIGGGQIGYNFQVYQNIILGGEADIQGLAGNGTNASRWIGGPNSRITVLSNQQVSGSLNWLGTVRGRIGYTITPTLLVYGTGGLAYGGVNASLQQDQILNAGTYGTVGINSGRVYGSNTLVGYTAGGGLEWMFLPNWSAKAEYLYYNLGGVSGSGYNMLYPQAASPQDHTPRLASITNYRANVSGNIARAGVSYHFNFGSAPVVAKF